MELLEKIIDEIKQLSRKDKEYLIKFLHRETKRSQKKSERRSEQKKVSIPEPIDLENLEPELKWLMENGWILEKCRGQYIALKGAKLIAHGTLREVLAESKRRGIERPYTQYIPKSETEWLLGRGNFPINDA